MNDAQNRTVTAQGAPHMTPAQAAQSIGVSRWTIVRAIKGLKLKAIRDNRGNWRISPNDLADWCNEQSLHSVRDGAVAHATSASAQAVEQQAVEQITLITSLRADLAKAEQRAAVAEAMADERARALDAAERNLADLRRMLPAPSGSSLARPWWRFWV